MILVNQIALIKISQIIKAFQPEIIHTNIGPVHLGYHLAKKFRIHHVWHIRELQTLDFGLKPFPSMNVFKKKLKNPFNTIITVSKTIHQFWGSLSNAQVIYDGVILSNNKIPIQEKEKYFLFVGRISYAKGIHEVIETFTEFCKINHEFQLKVIGTGSHLLEKKLKKYVSDHKIEHRVEFLGFCDNVAEYMKKAYAIVVASKNEAFGLVTVEAMANGCLVIGKATSGTAEILENGKFGFVYNNNQELLSLMHKVASMPVEEFMPIVLQAQKKVYEFYTIENTVKQIRDLYDSVLTLKL
jgi:glycosyltransferase involved in cell wall biosynthesis